jgi:hypothetical protein
VDVWRRYLHERVLHVDERHRAEQGRPAKEFSLRPLIGTIAVDVPGRDLATLLWSRTRRRRNSTITGRYCVAASE